MSGSCSSAWRGDQTSEKERGSDPDEVETVVPQGKIVNKDSKAGMSERVNGMWQSELKFRKEKKNRHTAR
jgi:hypothetical protein